MTTQTTAKLPDMLLWLDANRGRYLPQSFANTIDRSTVRGIASQNWRVLEKGPDSFDGDTDYWNTWEHVLNIAIVTYNGTEFRLHQDGDLWLVPCGMEWDDKNETFVWPNERIEGEAV